MHHSGIELSFSLSLNSVHLGSEKYVKVLNWPYYIYIQLPYLFTLFLSLSL